VIAQRGGAATKQFPPQFRVARPQSSADFALRASSSPAEARERRRAAAIAMQVAEATSLAALWPCIELVEFAWRVAASPVEEQSRQRILFAPSRLYRSFFPTSTEARRRACRSASVPT